MCSMSVLCPLCAQTSFDSIDALRVSLIKAANGPLACPICHDLFLGLDKLTIHLFSHTNIMAVANTTPKETTTTNSLAFSPKATTTTVEVSSDPTLLCSISPNMVKSEVKAAISEKNTKKFKQTDIEGVQRLQLTQQSSNNNNNNNNNILQQTDTACLSTCDICEFAFRNAELRDMHFRLVHQNLTTTTGYAHSASTSPTHNSLRSEYDFKCHLCAKTFKMKGSLRVHLKVVHLMGLPCVNNSPKLSICDRIRHKEVKSSTKLNAPQTLPTCQIVGDDQRMLQSNTNSTSSQKVVATAATAQLHNNNNNNNFNDNSNLNNNIHNPFPVNALPTLPAISNEKIPNNSLLSINCNGEIMQSALVNTDSTTVALSANLDSNVLLVFNANAITLPSSTQPDYELDREEGLSKTSSDNPKIWECDACGKAFTTKYFLKKHKRLHTGEMPYTCEICARTFTFQQSYHKHLLYHSDEKPHVCVTCGRAFKELSTLHNHERIHSGQKPFKCEVCGKCFRQRVSFLVHTRIHTGVMPYKCDICQRSFRYKVSQRTHKCDGSPKVEEPSQDANAESDEQLSENFLKAFLESASANLSVSQHSPASAEVCAITAGDCNGNLDEALLTKTIDDIVVESCNKLGIGNESTVPTQHLHAGHGPPECGNGDGSNSPLQQLRNMRLYSPQQVVADMSGAEGAFARYLFDDVSAHHVI